MVPAGLSNAACRPLWIFLHPGRENGGNVPGAVDNLSASALAVSMCRFLVKNPTCIPEDTEIRFISFGSEEAGLRGSRRYVARHLDELKRLDTRLLNFEMVAHPEINILTTEVNGTVKNSPGMVKAWPKRQSVPGCPTTFHLLRLEQGPTRLPSARPASRPRHSSLSSHQNRW